MQFLKSYAVTMPRSNFFKTQSDCRKSHRIIGQFKRISGIYSGDW